MPRSAGMIAALLVAAVLRIGLLVAEPAIEDEAVVAGGNVTMAESLRDGNGFAMPGATDALKVPGQAVVIASTWVAAPGDDDLTGLQVVQLLLDLVNVGLIWLLGREMFGPAAATVGAFAYAVCPSMVVLSTQALDAVWLTTACLACLLLWRRNAHPAWIGLVAGIGAYFRPTALLIPIVLAATSFLLAHRREALRTMAFGLGVGYLIFMPWVLRQSVAHETALPLGRTGTGQTAWEALGRLPNEHGAVLDDEVTYRQVHAAEPDLQYGSPAYDSYLLDRWTDVARNDPGHVLEVAGVQASDTLLWPSLHYRSIDTRLDGPYGSLLVAGALLGVVLCWSRREVWLVLVVLVGAWTLVHAPFVFQARMVLPAIAPAYCLLAGAGTSALVARRTG